MKSALITGVTGQDGAYLAEFLLGRGYEVYGLVRRSSSPNLWRLKEIKDSIKLIGGDLTDNHSLVSALEIARPHEVYNLGAQSFVQSSFTQPKFTAEVTALGVLNILEAIRTVDKNIKFYQASSSEMFGKVRETPQTEKTPFYPRSPYGVAKVFGHYITVNYRESYNMFNCSGILFNHESPKRGEEFVTRKITQGIARIKQGLNKELRIGNLEAKRDWGYAKDYVKAMWLMLQQDKPDDYVIATNESHSVREFIELACRYAGMDDFHWEGVGIDEKGVWEGKPIVAIDKKFFRPAEVDYLQGDYSKAKEKLGWIPETKFNELVKIMVEADLKRLG